MVLGGSPPTVLKLAPRAAVLLADGRLTVTDAATAALARRLLDTGVAVPEPAHRGADPVTVIVPVKDNPTGLRRLLDALAHTASPDEIAEILVVDDGSADPVVADGTKVLRHAESRGPAAARNTGLAAARTELVVFCDSDMAPAEPGWITALAAHFTDPGLALVAPRITALDTEATTWIARYERARSSLDLGRVAGPVRPGSRVSYVPSALLMARAAALGGGFDASMHVAEDVDLVFRLHRAGWRLRYVPDVEVPHDHRVEIRSWLRRKAFYGTGAAPLAKRHPGLVPPARLTPWAAAAWLSLAVGRRWGVLPAAVLAAVATRKLAASLDPLERPLTTAAALTGRGLAGAGEQIARGLVRHWWPLAAVAALTSKRARRALLVAAVAEGILDWTRYGRTDPLPGHLPAHRLDDLAYGAGLWFGAIRHRTVAPLLPRVTRRTEAP